VEVHLVITLCRATWAGFLGLALAAPAVAGEPGANPDLEKAKLKELSPVKVLQAAVKNLQKAKGYRVDVEIVGGLSMTEDHAVSQKNVQSQYSGEVHGPMMKVEDPKVFRTVKSGAAFIDGQWRYAVSDPKTLLLERLFTFPEVILARALRNAPSNGKWVKESEVLVKGDSVRTDVVEIPSDEEETPEGRTVVVKKKATTPEEEFFKTYRIIRVEAPPQEALQNFTEVQNSNCFGGG
jgi:hypothetical protein